MFERSVVGRNINLGFWIEKCTFHSASHDFCAIRECMRYFLMRVFHCPCYNIPAQQYSLPVSARTRTCFSTRTTPLWHSWVSMWCEPVVTSSTPATTTYWTVQSCRKPCKTDSSGTLSSWMRTLIILTGNNNNHLLFIKAHFQHWVLLNALYSKNIKCT